MSEYETTTTNINASTALKVFDQQHQNLTQQSGGETASQVLSAQVKAMIEARIIVAKRSPRDMDIVREKMLKECKRPYFSEVAIYSKPIGNQRIEGPSIRFAESAIRCMGNISIETNAIYDDENKKIIRVTAIDIESNTSYYLDIDIEKTVERKFAKKGDSVLSKRYNSKNEIVYILRAREDELIIKQNAMISKEIRTIGLRLIPGDIIDEAMDEIKKTLAKKDREDPDAAKRKVFDSFNSIGVSVEDLKTYLGHEAKFITQIELQELRGIYQSIKDGELSWQTVMLNLDERAIKTKEDKTKELLNSNNNNTATATATIITEDKKEVVQELKLSYKTNSLLDTFADEIDKLTKYLINKKTLKENQTIKDLTEDQMTFILKNAANYKQKIGEMK